MLTPSKAVAEDCDFLAKAIIQAERAHTGIGLWDIFASGSFLNNAMKQVCLNHSESGFHFSNFLVIRDSNNGDPVACCSGYEYPKFSLGPTINAVSNHLTEWTDKERTEGSTRLEFLETAFPPNLDWESPRWMIEGVYTDPSYRGNGYGETLLRAILKEGENQKFQKCWITCAIGNNAALRLYQKLGFQIIGEEPNSIDCMNLLHSPGFYVLEYIY